MGGIVVNMELFGVVGLIVSCRWGIIGVEIKVCSCKDMYYL